MAKQKNKELTLDEQIKEKEVAIEKTKNQLKTLEMRLQKLKNKKLTEENKKLQEQITEMKNNQ